MSVLVIQGPHRTEGVRAALATPLFDAFAQRVRKVGSALELASCNSAGGLVRCLRRARDQRVEVVLVDSGELDALDCARHEAQLRQALDALSAPYIEIHDQHGCDLEGRVRPAHFALAIVVMSRDLAKGYTVGMGIALRRLTRAGDVLQAPSRSQVMEA